MDERIWWQGDVGTKKVLDNRYARVYVLGLLWSSFSFLSTRHYWSSHRQDCRLLRL